MNVPDWDSAHMYSSWWNTKETDTFWIEPNGFISGIVIEPRDKRDRYCYPHSEHEYNRAKFTLRDGNMIPIRSIAWLHSLDSCGIAFLSPLANQSNLFRYSLRMDYPEAGPMLRVRVLAMMPKRMTP
jgi:hypothetical protein